jgi:hypothetical protein
MKIMYTRPEDGGVSIVVAAPKEAIEKVLGPLTQEQYEAHVIERSIPEGAINVRAIEDDGIPVDREFRNAWVDVTPEAKVDIDLVKAKELKLAELRRARDVELAKLDKQFMIALERGEDLGAIKARKQELRDATDPLKALHVEGVNDDSVIARIKELAVLDKE